MVVAQEVEWACGPSRRWHTDGDGIENVACLTQQEALDAPSDRLVAYVLLDGEAVLGGNHALVEAQLLVGAVVAVKEREHSVEHGPDLVNLVRLV